MFKTATCFCLLIFLFTPCSAETTDRGKRIALLRKHGGVVKHSTSREQRNLHVDLSTLTLTPKMVNILRDLKGIEILNLNETNISDHGLINIIKNQPHLLRLGIGKCGKITEKGVQAIWSLPKLQALDLGGNCSLTDEGLQGIHQAKNLRSLNIEQTWISDKGLREVAKLPDLQSLNLRNNVNEEFTNSGLKHLAGLRKLKKLWLKDNNHTDAGLRHLQNLKHLEEISLTEKMTVHGLRKLVSHVKQIRVLDISNCKWSEHDYKILSECSNLEYLTAGWCFTDECLKHLGKCQKLRRLRFFGGTIDGKGFKYLSKVKQLKRIDFWTLTELSHLCDLARIENLIELNFHSSLLLTKDSVRDLARLPNLQRLGVTVYSKAHEASVDSIKSLKKLRRLAVFKTLTDFDLERLTVLKELETLSVFACPISNRGLKHLSRFKKLAVLDVSFTDISDDGIVSIKKLAILKELDISATNITARGAKRLRRYMPNCVIRYYPKQEITGSN